MLILIEFKFQVEKCHGQDNYRGNQRRQMKGGGGGETKESNKCGVCSGSSNLKGN